MTNATLKFRVRKDKGQYERHTPCRYSQKHIKTVVFLLFSLTQIFFAFEMFNKLFTLAALTTLAVATPTNLSARADCTTGPIQCCNTVTTAKDPVVTPILAAIGVVLQDLNVGVGLTCSPVTVIGGGNGGCNASPVCCTDNSHGTLISIGCVPVSL
ncbi:hypothetical protein PM082_018678 [Marasmius tenuissimus]|nr:hypothetical protein PM082_018678 [Marasmius tenuissimus]